MVINANKGTLREKVIGGLRAATMNSIGFRMMPMIDVLFLMLIFFLLTSRFHAQEAVLPFRLPVGNGELVPGSVGPLGINLKNVNGKCVLAVGDESGIELTENQINEQLVMFANEMARVLKKQTRTATDPVELICGDSVQWQYVAKVYNVLYGMGISDITFRITEYE